MQLRIEWDGKTYDYDAETIDVRQGVVIKTHTGLGLLGFEQACAQLDPQALQALLWLIRTQNGERCNISELNFPMLTFGRAFGDAYDRAQQAAAAAGVADPTPAGEPAAPTAGPTPTSAS